MCGFTTFCSCTRSHPGFCSPFLHSVVLILLVDSEGPDQTADVQADLGFCCPHMLVETF